jgi:hypothetical protein
MERRKVIYLFKKFLPAVMGSEEWGRGSAPCGIDPLSTHPLKKVYKGHCTEPMELFLLI